MGNVEFELLDWRKRFTDNTRVSFGVELGLGLGQTALHERAITAKSAFSACMNKHLHNYVILVVNPHGASAEDTAFEDGISADGDR